MARESSAARIGMMARHLLVHGRVIGPDELVERIEAVDAGRVRAHLAETFSAGLPTVAVVGAGAAVPDAEAVAERLGGTTAAPVAG